MSAGGPCDRLSPSEFHDHLRRHYTCSCGIPRLHSSGRFGIACNIHDAVQASAIETEGQDAEERLGAEHESAAREAGDAQ